MVYMIELGLEGAQFISFVDGSCRLLGFQGFARAPVHLLLSLAAAAAAAAFSFLCRVEGFCLYCSRLPGVGIGLGFVDEEDRALPRAMQRRLPRLLLGST